MDKEQGRSGPMQESEELTKVVWRVLETNASLRHRTWHRRCRPSISCRSKHSEEGSQLCLPANRAGRCMVDWTPETAEVSYRQHSRALQHYRTFTDKQSGVLEGDRNILAGNTVSL